MSKSAFEKWHNKQPNHGDACEEYCRETALYMLRWALRQKKDYCKDCLFTEGRKAVDPDKIRAEIKKAEAGK